ncbi:phosphate regulon sensor histidine kinase PhoR [Peteryoungia desertarenae]|uniref:histidine kinase n=1 Tax=Peteryoungia desertarenae TaxID=1813451 RepID=A0ABX6QLZ1_9HYPH|nr:phosphate regulon sensor histidine kinase PhoR [Peteryoungia desertarenae]QLF69272.1 phosphate regulon sensor histidine kinase PhoR [Peteryoungia desertarenae]
MLNEDRSDLRHAFEPLLVRWRQIAVAAIVSMACYLAGAQAGFAIVLFVIGLVYILFRQDGTDSEEVAAPPVALESQSARPDPDSVVQEVIEALDKPIFIIGQDGHLRGQNSVADKAFGPPVGPLHVSTRFRSPGILDMIRETIETGEPNQIEHSERLPSERVYTVRIAPMTLETLNPIEPLFLLSFRDISELRRLDRMRSDFVANASHELRTPLASLRGFIETLLGPARADPKAQERFLGIMLDQANRMSRLVDDLLSLSRLELKAHIAPDQKVDLAPVLGHVRDSLAPLAAELDVTIDLHLPEEQILVVGDRDELVQVFENLIENACKYGQEGKRVDIYLRHTAEGGTEVSVVDCGPGIPTEHVPRLTERFYRVNIEDSRSKKGTGLGLAIVKHILTRHRARLVVRSELGKGTDFTVRF